MKTLVATILVLALSGCLQGQGPPSRPQPLNDHEALLWPSPDMTIHVRVHAVQSHRPSDLALQGLNQTIFDVTGKRAVLDGISDFPAQNGTYTDAQLDAMAAAAAAQEPPVQGVILRLMYVDGSRAGDEPIGVYSGNDTLFVFLDQIDTDLLIGVWLPGLGINELRPYSERSVLIHELGHAFGLVNCGIPMLTSREDSDSRCHSTENDSVMQPGFGNVLSNPAKVASSGVEPIWHFNQHDLEDLAAFRSSAIIQAP